MALCSSDVLPDCIYCQQVVFSDLSALPMFKGTISNQYYGLKYLSCVIFTSGVNTDSLTTRLMKNSSNITVILVHLFVPLRPLLMWEIFVLNKSSHCTFKETYFDVQSATRNFQLRRDIDTPPTSYFLKDRNLILTRHKVYDYNLWERDIKAFPLELFFHF